MKVLIIGGTGTISSAITRLLSQSGCELYLLNRGNRNKEFPSNVKMISADINQEEEVNRLLGSLSFDTICEFIGFTREHVERDYRLFKDRTKQYIFISSASAYQKPLADYRITEATSLSNPYWE